MPRLVPPWQPMTVVAETESLADGRAVLGLPGGLRWIAQHDRDGLRPAAPLRRRALVGGAAVPAAARDRSVAAHPRVLRGARAAAPRVARRGRHHGARLRRCGRRSSTGTASSPTIWPPTATQPRRASQPMVVAVTGASGLVGSALSAFLTHRRTPGDPAGPTSRAVEGRTAVAIPMTPRPTCCPGVDAVVHLAGRVDRGAVHRRAQGGDPRQPHRADAPAGRGRRPTPTTGRGRSSAHRRSASTGSTAATRCCARRACAATGFLADVVADWEAATGPPPMRGCVSSTCAPESCRPRPAARCGCCGRCSLAGLGGRLGSGRQWLSWIGLDDLLDVYYRALYDTRLTGPVNAVGPEPVRNADYTKALAGVLHRPAVLPVPSFGPRLLLGGQGARELAEADQRVVPTKLTDAGPPVPARHRRRRAGPSTRARLTGHSGQKAAHQAADAARGALCEFCCRRT